jgi:hypothetical protein
VQRTRSFPAAASSVSTLASASTASRSRWLNAFTWSSYCSIRASSVSAISVGVSLPSLIAAASSVTPSS